MKKGLCEICRPKQWNTISSDMLESQGYPVYGANGVIGYYSEYNHEEETLLITCRGATCGALNICQPFSYVNGNAMALDNLLPEVDLKYLYYYLLARGLSDTITGSAQPQIVRQSLEKVIVDYPILEEQRRIAALLDKVSDLIAKRRAQLDKLDLLVKARFVEITENSETVPTRMGDVATYINGYAFKPTNWSKNGLPIIRIQNLNNANAEYNYFDGVLAEKYLVHRGDVLVSWATHLEAYIWKGHDAWLNQHIFKVAFDKMPINDVYFVYSTEEALRQAFRNAHGFKPTMEHIKRSDFEDAVIRLPNVEVQSKFAKFATQVDKLKLTIQQSLDTLEILKKALMQQYFG